MTSTAIAWPMTTPSSVATSASALRPMAHILRSTAGLGGAAGVKNLRNRARSDRPQTNDLIASQSAADAARISTVRPAAVLARGDDPPELPACHPLGPASRPSWLAPLRWASGANWVRFTNPACALIAKSVNWT
jgi:hypothetical protein